MQVVYFVRNKEADGADRAFTKYEDAERDSVRHDGDVETLYVYESFDESEKERAKLNGLRLLKQGLGELANLSESARADVLKELGLTLVQKTI